MSSDNQWFLLKESEDIVMGDWIVVDSDDGEENMKLLKDANNRIMLKSRKGRLHVFDQDTLEEMSDDEFSSSRYITAKGG